MTERQGPQPEGRRQRPQEQPPLRSSPTELMSPEDFAKWMSFAVSPEILTPERLALLKRMSEDLARDPAFLRRIERMLADYGDDIYQISPTDADLAKGGFGWAGRLGADGVPVVAVAPAAAAAALAPPAASLAAAHAPGE